MGDTSGKKKKQKKRHKNKPTGNKKPFFSGSNRSRVENFSPTNTKKTAEQRQQQQPDLSVNSFPALNEDASKNLELVVVDQIKDETLAKQQSDSASIATTTSSSSASVSKKQQLGGYAAALLKSKHASGTTVKADNSGSAGKKGEVRTNRKKEFTSDEGISNKPQTEIRSANKGNKKEELGSKRLEPVVITPPAWGDGKSFADVLRKEEARTVAI